MKFKNLFASFCAAISIYSNGAYSENIDGNENTIVIAKYLMETYTTESNLALAQARSLNAVEREDMINYINSNQLGKSIIYAGGSKWD